MFSIFKKKSANVSNYLLPFETDIHSHILPGIDDGSPTLETSINLIKALIKLGVKQSIATPHIIGDLYRNNATTITNALNTLRNEIQHQQLDFKVNAAAEYMLDFYFLELMAQKIPLLTLKDNIILTEFSYADRPQRVEEMLFPILTEGYQPILAHPERYAYYHNNYKHYHHLIDIGFLLQVNMLSFTGYYGNDVAKAAHYLIKNNLASFVATDLHHLKHVNALNNSKNHQLFSKILQDNKFNGEFSF
jgi:protein-tyrosine phosphatase